jgi:hypothetical protein
MTSFTGGLKPGQLNGGHVASPTARQLLGSKPHERGPEASTRSMIAASQKGITMKKPILSIDEPEPKKAMRADRPPTEGFATIVDGHFKSEFDTTEGAEAAGRALKSVYPMLQIEIYNAANKVRTLLS